LNVRHQFSQEDRPIRQTIEQLDRVSRAMNPVLFFVAVALVVLNLACVVNLIDWRGVVPQPSAAAATSGAPTAPITAKPASATAAARIALPADSTRTATPSD
jgi:hypothetical protein